MSKTKSISALIGFILLKPVHGTCKLNPTLADTGLVAKALCSMSLWREERMIVATSIAFLRTSFFLKKLSKLF